jgi:hypothetical protein
VELDITSARTLAAAQAARTLPVPTASTSWAKAASRIGLEKKARWTTQPMCASRRARVSSSTAPERESRRGEAELVVGGVRLGEIEGENVSDAVAGQQAGQRQPADGPTARR